MGWGTGGGGCIRGQSVCVFACATCRLWVRWVVVWGTNWNERRCASLSQHGRSICQGDITALTPHPSPPGATEPCSSWWLISIPPSLHCIHTPLPPSSEHSHTAAAPHMHTHKQTNTCTRSVGSPPLHLRTHPHPHPLPTHGWSPGPRPVTHINFLIVPNTNRPCSLVESGSVKSLLILALLSDCIESWFKFV